MLYAGLRSPNGVSFRVLQLIDSGLFKPNISVPLVLEYESVIKRNISMLSLGIQDIEDVLDYLCQTASAHKVYYLWRPLLRDANDEMILELAVAATCDAIVTFNVKDFRGAEQFDIRLLKPIELLNELGAHP